MLTRLIIHDLFFNLKTNYADGIKSYRLKDDRIFNIELEEEKTACETMDKRNGKHSRR